MILTCSRVAASFEDGRRRGENRPKSRRRNDPDSCPVGLVDELGVAGVDFGKHRLGGHEHEGGIGGFARNDVLGRDVVDVGGDISGECFSCGLTLRLR